MSNERSLPWLIIGQVIVTLALLGVAVVLDDSNTAQVIVGAVVGNWLSEGSRLGRQVFAVRNGGTDDQSTEDTGTAPKGA